MATSLPLPFVEPHHRSDKPTKADPAAAPSAPAKSSQSPPEHRLENRLEHQPEHQPGNKDHAVVRSSPSSLWLAVCLPELVLESHIGPAERELEAAVIGDIDGQLKVLAVTPVAARQGIACGMALPGAMALVPGIRLYTHFPERAAATLQQLASKAHRYTPSVVLAAPDMLLLEVAASRKLFGGLRPLLDQLVALFQRAGHALATALAPTPQAADWLARSRPGTILTKLSTLESALRVVPLAALGWPDAVLKRFNAIGVRDLGACRRLPRAGFAKRFGPARLLEIDRAYGKALDPRRSYQAPECFQAELELTHEISDTALLQTAAGELLVRLARFARRRQWCVREMRFTFYPLEALATERVLRPGDSAQDLAHWQRLLELDLEYATFSAPSLMIELYVDQFEPLQAATATLPFTARPGVQVATTTGLLLTRLRARLGESAVQALELVADHRPERAVRSITPVPASRLSQTQCSPWRQLLVHAGKEHALTLQRPLWLLQKPFALPEYFGADVTLRLFRGPERIESGWWDGADVSRDYYLASTGHGVLAWVFRERDAIDVRWYVHGLFG